MDMQVADALTAIGTVVDDEPKAVRALLLADLAGNVHQVPKQLLLVFTGRFDAVEPILHLRDTNHVDGCLRINVTEAKGLVVLVNDGCRDFPTKQLVEDGRSTSIVHLAPGRGGLGLFGFVRHAAEQPR